MDSISKTRVVSVRNPERDLYYVTLEFDDLSFILSRIPSELDLG